MSDPLLMEETKPREETVTKPPTRWKNKWRARTEMTCKCHLCGRKEEFCVGHEYATPCCRDWPDRDTAETDAHRAMEMSGPCALWVEYLGAFPLPGATP